MSGVNRPTLDWLSISYVYMRRWYGWCFPSFGIMIRNFRMAGPFHPESPSLDGIVCSCSVQLWHIRVVSKRTRVLSLPEPVDWAIRNVEFLDGVKTGRLLLECQSKLLAGQFPPSTLMWHVSFKLMRMPCHPALDQSQDGQVAGSAWTTERIKVELIENFLLILYG